MKECPGCQHPMIYVALKDPNVQFELDRLVKTVYNKEIHISEYWEGWYCFLCGVSEIGPVELQDANVESAWISQEM